MQQQQQQRDTACACRACLCLPRRTQDAPYKQRGKIPYGVQRGSYGLTAEEKMRRRWREWAGAGTAVNGAGSPALAAAGSEPSYQVRLGGGAGAGWCCGSLVVSAGSTCALPCCAPALVLPAGSAARQAAQLSSAAVRPCVGADTHHACCTPTPLSPPPTSFSLSLSLPAQDLVSSFQAVCSAAAEQLAPAGELDVSALVGEPGALADAVDVSKESVIEWMEAQEALLAKQGAAEPEFVFRVKPATYCGRL